MNIDQEKIFENISLENSKLKHQINTLYKLCEKLQFYIEKHNLLNQKVLIENSNGISINKLSDFDKITYLKVPSAIFVMDDREAE